jgi:hypothetical protein
VTVVVTMIVVVKVTVAVIVAVIVGLNLYFRVEIQGKERGLYPPSDWSRRIRELEPKNQGVVASF